jgi:cysteine desulfurase
MRSGAELPHLVLSTHSTCDFSAQQFMPSLYFDHNATTFLAPEVAEAYAAALQEVHGNASSVHRAGQIARQGLEMSRRFLSEAWNAAAQEAVFTSGGTESNNLAILGLVRTLPGERKHVVTTAIEHPSVLECCRQLEREGVAVSHAAVSSDGVVDTAAIRREIRPETVLVSVMHANNETGMIQPIAEIASVVRELRKAGQQIFLHSDGVQAFGKIRVDVQKLGVDLYSVSGHKIFAPKGIGALFVRKGTPLKGIQHGGRHERERRAGTENVPAAIALATAVKLVQESSTRETEELRDRFESEAIAALDEVEVNGVRDKRLPNTSNLLFRDVSGEALVIALDMKGIAISSGSACSSGSVEPSHVLLAMGRTIDEARSSVRFSLGRYNGPEEIDTLIRTTVSSVRQLRRSVRKERSFVSV